MGSVLFEEKNRCSGRRFRTRARPDDCRVERILQVHRRLCRQGLEASAGSILLLTRPPPPPAPTPSFQHNCVSSSWVWVLGKRQAGGSEAWNGWVNAGELQEWRDRQSPWSGGALGFSREALASFPIHSFDCSTNIG